MRAAAEEASGVKHAGPYSSPGVQYAMSRGAMSMSLAGTLSFRVTCSWARPSSPTCSSRIWSTVRRGATDSNCSIANRDLVSNDTGQCFVPGSRL